ncbi:MAG TPA: hypothetical protein VGB23_02870 [Nitrospirota bacterium]
MTVSRLARLAIIFVLLLTAVAMDAIAPGGAKAASPDADAVVAGVVKAYGGKDAIAAVKSVHAKGGITAVMRDDKGTYTRYLERDKKLRVETKYARSSELRILDGEQGWRGEDKTSMQKVVSFQYQAMLYQYKQLELPYGLSAGQYKVRLAGEGLVKGKHAYILALDSREGPPMDVYVDSKDFTILKVVGYFNAEGKQLDLSVEFGDYRKTGGTLLPFRAANYSGGNLIGETVIKDCKVNQKMDASLFKP